MKKLFRVILLFFGFVFGFNNLITNTLADGATGPHGGQVIQNDGLKYEVVNNILDHQIQVYAPQHSAREKPSSITLKIKKNDTVIDRIHLLLVPDEDPNTPSYTGKVPANISISGGISFDIDF